MSGTLRHVQEVVRTNRVSAGSEVDPQTLTQFLTAVRNDPVYELSVALQPEWCDREAHKWAELWNLGVEVETAPFIDVLARHGIEIDTDDGRWSVGFAPGIDESFTLVCQHKDGTTGKYTATVEQLSTLTFETILWVRLLHPLNQEVKQFVSRSRTLASIVEELAALADVDYAFPSVDAEGVSVHHCVRGRSVKECLRIVASVVGWSMTVNGNREWIAEDADVTFSHCVAQYRENIETSGDDLRSRWVSPNDTVETLLADTARELKRDRLVVVLTPNLTSS